MKLLLEFDDYGQHNCDKELEYFIDKYPRIIFNLFTVPYYADKIQEKFRKHKNIVHAYHGFTHAPLEFRYVKKTEALRMLFNAKVYFQAHKIESIKVFRAPYWQINQGVIDALIDENFTHIYTHEDFKNLDYHKIKPVYYNWNLKDNFTESLKENKIIIAHGHTHNVCENGLPEITNRLDEFLQKNYNDIEFLRVDDI